jgi:hypothetical protein
VRPMLNELSGKIMFKVSRGWRRQMSQFAT